MVVEGLNKDIMVMKLGEIKILLSKASMDIKKRVDHLIFLEEQI